MKITLTILCLWLSSIALFAQNNFWLIRLTPKQQEASLNYAALKEFANNYSDSTVAFGLLDDRSGIIILKSTSQSWEATWKSYALFTSPLNINYNVFCKILEKGINASGTFVQYNTQITKFNVQQAPQLQNIHYNYLKQLKNIGSVLLEGHFNNDDGGLVLFEGKIENEVIYADPSVRSGFIIPEIIEGTFLHYGQCEGE